MRILLGVVSAYIVLVIYGQTAMAVDVVQPQTSVAQIQSPWVIEEFTRDNGTPTGECIMRANYTNGLEITFKGKQGKLSALRVRDLQGGRVKGFLGLGLDQNSYGLQSRSVDGQIDASLLTVPAVAQKIIDLGIYRLRIGTEDYYFSSSVFVDAYAKLLECQGADGLQTLKVVNEPFVMLTANVEDHILKSKDADTPEMPAEPVDLVMAQDLNDYEGDIDLSNTRESGENIPLVMALPMIVPSDYTFKLDRQIDAMKPISWESNAVWFETLQDALDPIGYELLIAENNIRISLSDETKTITETEKKDNIQLQMTTWVAQKGDKLSSVLSTWARQAGVKPNIELVNDPQITKNFTIYGPLDIAVNRLLKETIPQNMPSAMISTEDGDVVKIAEASTLVTNEDNKTAAMPKEPVNEIKWRALQGTNLRKVLQRWSAKENIDFVWNADQQFLIKQSIKTMTDYNGAVAALIEQFKGQDIRPVATLNVDPDTGKKTLIVTMGQS